MICYMLSYMQTPTLVLGPFGCGKTETLQEFVKLVSMNTPDDIKMLICTHTNSAADIYVQKLHTEWLRSRQGMYVLLSLSCATLFSWL